MNTKNPKSLIESASLQQFKHHWLKQTLIPKQHNNPKNQILLKTTCRKRFTIDPIPHLATIREMKSS